jgi:hypothetical protein
MQYKLQRRLPQDTGFITIASFTGKSQAFQKNAYSYDDTLKNFAGIAQYRVQQVIGADTTLLIGAGAVDILNACTSADGPFVLITPNPVRNNVINLRISATQNLPALYINITDMQGRPVKQLKRSAPLGSSTQQVVLDHVPPGMYIVKIFNGNSEVFTGKIIKR